MRPNSTRWIKDPTGRFPERPYFSREDLDSLSEEWMVGFLIEMYGEAEFPVSTEDLKVMIECDTSDLDQYADLREEGEEDEEVQGLTLFYPDRKPVVKIAQELSDSIYREHRLRTTLTHEFAHVKLHADLWPFDQMRLFPDEEELPGPRCKRPGDIGGYGGDWMEWQAGYVSGAMLMPISRITGLVQATFNTRGCLGRRPVYPRPKSGPYRRGSAPVWRFNRCCTGQAFAIGLPGRRLASQFVPDCVGSL